MNRKDIRALLEHLHRTGALSVPPSDLQMTVEEFRTLTPSEELREIIGQFYAHGTALGSRLEDLLPRIEALEVVLEAGVE